MTTAADALRTAAARLHPSSPAVAAHTVAASVHPDVIYALADWLDSAAVDAEQIGPDPRAVAVARAINGGQP